MSEAGRPSLLFPAIACLTLGLAPYWPLPHVVEKLLWLAQGRALQPIDWFDLLLWHGAPWIWLAAAAWRRAR